jgi:hypothetical protein
MTLNETLKELGYTTKKAGGLRMYQKHILKDGEIVFTGSADEVWKWLKRKK